jgi:hypothetical protein
LEEQWESHIAGLVAMLLTAAACIWLKRECSPGWAFGVGALAALALYVNPILGGVYLVWVVFAGRSAGYLNRRVLPLWLAPLLMTAPWAFRNMIELRALVPMRDDAGIELYVSYNDCAPYSFRENMRFSCIQRFHPNSSVEEARAVRALGEYRYNRNRLRKALEWIRLHPMKSVGLTGERAWFFWFPSEDGLRGYGEQRTRMLALHLLTVASLFGLYRLLKPRTAPRTFVLFWVGLFPLIYYFVQFEYRYRYPILWTTWLLAAEGLLQLRVLICERRSQSL